MLVFLTQYYVIMFKYKKEPTYKFSLLNYKAKFIYIKFKNILNGKETPISK